MNPVMNEKSLLPVCLFCLMRAQILCTYNFNYIQNVYIYKDMQIHVHCTKGIILMKNFRGAHFLARMTMICKLYAKIQKFNYSTVSFTHTKFNANIHWTIFLMWPLYLKCNSFRKIKLIYHKCVKNRSLLVNVSIK